MAGTGAFRVANGQLLGPDDMVCALRGINIGDDALTQAVQDDQCRPLTTLFPNIQVVRLACGSNSFPAPTGVLKTAVDRLLANNIVVRVENHLFPQQSPPVNQANANFYAAWASTYKNDPFLQFIAANEPLDPGITDNHLNTYNAVRGTGSNAIVMFDPLGGGGPNRQGTAAFDASRYASLRNAGWDLHVYSWYWNAGETNASTIQNRIQQYIAECKAIRSLDGPMFVDINEYGDAWDGVNQDSNWRAVIAGVHAAGVGTAAWTWNFFPDAGADRLRTGPDDMALSDYGKVVADWVKGGQRASRTAGTTPGVTPSPNNFQVPRDGSTITDASGNRWAIAATQGGQVTVNGVTDTTTNNVVGLAYVTGKVWHVNANGQWYSKAYPSDSWNGPQGSPIIATSPNGFVVPRDGTAITDANGNTWTITPGAQVALNGIADTTTANVVQLAFVSNQVWQENASLLWWSKTVPTDTWMPLNGTTSSPIAGSAPRPSPEGTVVSTVGPAITDSNGNLWRITAATMGGSGKPRVSAPLSGNVATGNFVHGSLAGQQYDVLLPHNYDPNYLYPCLMFLHWNGLAYELYDHGTNSVVRDEGNYTNNVNFRKNYPCIVLMPDCDQRADGSGGAQINWGGYTKADQFSEGANMALLEDALTKYSIDRTRIYVTGTSLGGHGTWGHMIKYGARAGQKTTRRYFVAGLCCDGWSIEYFPSDNSLKTQLQNDPIWEWAGNEDGNAAPYGRQWFSAYGGGSNYDGSKAPNGNFRYTEIQGQGQGHGAGWGHAYDVSSGTSLAWDWLFQQSYGTLAGTGVATTQQVSVNGVVDATTSNVEKITFVSGRIWYQKNAAAGAGWFYKVVPSGSWTASSVGPFTTGGGSGLTNWFENIGGDGYFYNCRSTRALNGSPLGQF